MYFCKSQSQKEKSQSPGANRLADAVLVSDGSDDQCLDPRLALQTKTCCKTGGQVVVLTETSWVRPISPSTPRRACSSGWYFLCFFRLQTLPKLRGSRLPRGKGIDGDTSSRRER